MLPLPCPPSASRAWAGRQIAGPEDTGPVAARHRDVMNTREELRQAFQELNNGTFIKAG